MTAAPCPRCRGSGFSLRTSDQGVTSAAPCDCQWSERGAQLLRAARIPRRYDHCSFESLEDQHPSVARARARARRWVELWPAVTQGLLLQGEPGTGKTHLAVALGREVARKGGRVLFWEQRDLLKALQGTFDSGAALREAEVLGPVQAAELVILDDLGAGRTTDWTRDVMHDIIAQRYNEMRLMIVTTNCPLDQPELAQKPQAGLDAPLSLRDRLGDALMSRLYEMCEIVKLGGKDYRVGLLRHAGRHGG